ncbi:MAG: hypothetical protein OSB03_06530 [Vicinamibacterales bacterium]|nr:hypothetical protein [Vicinamibacterales bacterium]
MSNSRVALLAVGTALMGAWLSSAATTAPGAAAEPQLGGPVAVSAPEADPSPRLDLDHEVARLTARLEAAPRPRSPSRNPFTLGRRERAESLADSRVDQWAPETLLPGDTVVASPAVVGWGPVATPAITLAGIGAERTPTGFLHTAILSADGRVFLSHVGDEVMGRYQVRDVSAAAAVLLDHQTGESLHLTLP